MKIYVTVKSLAKKKAYITKVEINVLEKPNTLRELITQIVTDNVNGFNEKKAEIPFINYLSKTDIELQCISGKVGFNTKYNEKLSDVNQAIEVAILAFEDGLYKVFIEDTEAQKLDEPLVCNDGDEVAFIKFTMLAGRMW